MSHLHEISTNIRLYRRRLNLTQKQLAEKLHLSTQAVSSWEMGSTYPDIENLLHLSKIFCVSVDTLLKGTIEHNEVFMIGIDGGKVKSDFVLFSSLGTVLKRFRLAGTSASVQSVSDAISILRRGIDLCLLHLPSVSYIFIGNAGAHLLQMQQMLSEIYTGIEIFVTSCAANALMCIDEADGAMILGAGSGLFRPQGDTFQTFGGWGHTLGDPGSGYNFGRAACQLAYAYRDGLDDDPLIYDLVMQRMNGATLKADNLPPLQMSLLAPVIFDADAQGDQRAAHVIEKEMQDLSRLVNATCPNGGKIVAVGGVIEHCSDRLLPTLQKWINPSIEVVLSRFPAVFGACRACIKHFAIKTEQDFDDKFISGFASMFEVNS